MSIQRQQKNTEFKEVAVNQKWSWTRVDEISEDCNGLRKIIYKFFSITTATQPNSRVTYNWVVSVCDISFGQSAKTMVLPVLTDLYDRQQSIIQCRRFRDMMKRQGNYNVGWFLSYYTVCYNSFFFVLFSVQLIFTGEYTIAMNKSWHLGHFRCGECDISITGKQFIVREEKPICTDCFDQRFVNS